jgi:hypothetical protein
MILTLSERVKIHNLAIYLKSKEYSKEDSFKIICKKLGLRLTPGRESYWFCTKRQVDRAYRKLTVLTMTEIETLNI